MTQSLKKYIGKGLSPQQFIDAMTRNQDKFIEWYQRFAWTNADEQSFFHSLKSNRSGIHCLILAADWCGDVVRNVPVVLKVLDEAHIPVDLLIMEEHLELMDQYLTMGGRSIPVVLFINTEGEVLCKWGPRPKYIQEPMVEFKQNHTDKDAPDYDEHLKAARAAIMERYGEGTKYQHLIVEELKALLEHMQ